MSDPALMSDPNAVSDPNLTPAPTGNGWFPPSDTGPFPPAREYGPPPEDPPDGGHDNPGDPAYGLYEPGTYDPNAYYDPAYDANFEQAARAGRHLSAHARVRPGWTVAPGWLAVAALVLFIAAVIGNAGLQRSTGSDQPAEPSEERTAQAAPAAPESDGDPAAGYPEQPEPSEAPAEDRPPAQLTVLRSVNGEALGDVATYVDGTAAWVLETGHEDAGGGLVQVTVQVKLVNMGGEPVDVRTARVELTFADQSSRATRVARSELGTLAPNGGETVGDWVFRMPANQIRDLSVTVSPTDRHEPATFHGASN